MNYFYNGTFIGDWFGPGRYSGIFDNLDSGESLYNALKKLKVDYFLVNKNNFNQKLPEDLFFKNKFIIKFENQSCVVYSVK